MFGRIVFAPIFLTFAVGGIWAQQPQTVRATKNPDGTLETNRINVGRGEVVPQ